MSPAPMQREMGARSHLRSKVCQAVARLRQARSPSITLFNHIIHSFGQSGDVGRAALWFDELLRRDLLPNVCTMGAILNACAVKPDIKLLDYYTEMMPTYGIKHNEVTCNTLIKAFSNVGDVKRAEVVMQFMRSEGIQVSITTCNSLLHVYIRVGDIDQAAEFVTLVEKNIGTNAVTYNSMISAMAARGDVAAAQRWFAHMMSRNLTPSLVSYGAMCKAFGRRGQVDAVTKIMNSLESSGMNLNEYFFASLIFACGVCEPRDAKRAEKAVEDMAHRGMNVWKVKTLLVRVLGSYRTSVVLAQYAPGKKSNVGGCPGHRHNRTEIKNRKHEEDFCAKVASPFADVQTNSVECAQDVHNTSASKQVQYRNPSDGSWGAPAVGYTKSNSERDPYLYDLIRYADAVHPFFGDIEDNELVFGNCICL
eukprot:TRINITY_DN12487_c0_g1_i1.p1 TRINITY_DN12487_c0_g1~~TRINITY_DN12487_c0_g1_i1.p1  ORF type:complete len:422 (-),score=35.67 TRINITY_DN12487_c0_g1_i1:179-1444(-)